MTGQHASEPAGGGTGDLLASLQAVVARTRRDADTGCAYATAARVHAGQARKSGAPYITHPVAVAAILAEASADDQTICAALLHDTLDGTGYSLAALSAEFGAAVADLVTAAAALDDTGVYSRSSPDPAANCEPRTVPEPSAAPGPRVVMIKLADRLHNLRTVAPLPPASQLRVSRDTVDVLVPLAASLGLQALAAELENAAAATFSRHAPGSASTSARLLAMAAALLPAATRSRWRDEWAGELTALPARHQRALFAARTLAGIPRLAATLRRQRRAQ